MRVWQIWARTSLLLAPRGHINVLRVYTWLYLRTHGTCMMLRFIAQFATHQELLLKFDSMYLS